MGVRGLLSFLKQYSRMQSLDELLRRDPNLKIGIDISYYLYKWQGNTNRILEFLRKFQTQGHSILLIFDGRAEEGKQAESKRRKDSRMEELKTAASLQSQLNQNQELTDIQKQYLSTIVKEHEKRGWQLTREIRHAFKERLYEEQIPLLKAIGEADTLLASLAIRKELDIIISGDMDLLVLGTPIQYVPYDDGNQFYCFDRQQILQSLKLTNTQFRSFCAMCSTETSKSSASPPDIRKAYHGIRIFHTLEALQANHPSWLETWPTADHIFFRDITDCTTCLREDEMDRYNAFRNSQPMPYYQSIDSPLSYPSSVAESDILSLPCTAIL